MVTGSFHVLWGQNVPVYYVDPVCVSVRVCVWITNVILWFAVGNDDGNDRSIRTDSHSFPYTTSDELRTGCESNPKFNLAPWAATYWMYLKYLDKFQG